VNFKFQKYFMFMLNVSLGFSMRIESGVFPYNQMQTHNSIRSVFLSVTSNCLVIQSSSTFLLTMFIELYLFSVFTCVSFLASIFDLCNPPFQQQWTQIRFRFIHLDVSVAVNATPSCPLNTVINLSFSNRLKKIDKCLSY
jgi:hypothetical protein